MNVLGEPDFNLQSGSRWTRRTDLSFFEDQMFVSQCISARTPAAVELKQGYSAQKHALVAAKNLKLLMSGGKEGKLAIYEP
ncbi:hypothetical protein RDI58_027763 [Solanum bulbocastanum]|uniref:Uncharacterized protein n=1 Tax=Solanum bulbocastanum TaxID=147425 RepID=A0AAN8T198_SOLBU